jgi:hypothetical protein
MQCVPQQAKGAGLASRVPQPLERFHRLVCLGAPPAARLSFQPELDVELLHAQSPFHDFITKLPSGADPIREHDLHLFLPAQVDERHDLGPRKRGIPTVGWSDHRTRA